MSRMVPCVEVHKKLKTLIRNQMSFEEKNPLAFSSILLIFAVAVFFRVLVSSMFGTIQYDEAEHSIGGIFISKLFLNRLSDPGSYLGRYPTTMDSFWFYPPLYSMLAAIGFSLFGYAEYVARLTSVAFSILLIHPTIRIAQEVDRDLKVALISGFLVSMCSIIVIVGCGAMIDVPLTVLVMYSILFWIRGIKRGQGSDYLKAGLMGGFAGLMKPIGVGILFFMVAFQMLSFLTSRDRTIFHRTFWKGIFVGFLVFSIWQLSGLVVHFTTGGWIGDARFYGIRWFYLLWIFGRYRPPWYSPPWHTLAGWTYYGDQIIMIVGTLPFLLIFLGVGSRLFQKKRIDSLLLLFVLAVYTLQSLGSNKNPRYIIPVLPVLYIYGSIGVVSLYNFIAGRDLRGEKKIPAKRMYTVYFLIVVILLAGCTPLLSAIKNRYIPGMGFGVSLPYSEVLQIIRDDGSEGIIIPDVQENMFNVPVLTYYTAATDNKEKYGCYWYPTDTTEILNLKAGGKSAKFVLVYDLKSNLNRFVITHPKSFVLIGKAENAYGTIFIYKVARNEE